MNFLYPARLGFAPNLAGRAENAILTPMTKVQLVYELLKPVDENLMDQISRAHSIYGILRVALAPSLDRLTIEYDASRLSPLEVEARLHGMGIPIVLSV